MELSTRHTRIPGLSDIELTRREFLGLIGATAAATVAGTAASAQSVVPLFQDSFGNLTPAAGDALSAGAYPPPVFAGSPGPATVTPGYAQPNILMVIVDQLRSPRWLPTGGQAAIDAMLPNLAFLRDHSFNFPNYFVVATDCTPSRGCLLTGLYAQQTFLFTTQASVNEPNLQTGFPTFANALSQQAGYQTCWMGKWHVSDYQPLETSIGNNGPGDYGFSAKTLNLPQNNTLASPPGAANEGTDGVNSSPFGTGTPAPAVTVPSMPVPSYSLINDAAIANWFIDKWIPSAPASQPWFAAVSFVNPHDINDFPVSFGLAGTTNFGTIGTAFPYGYQPPPVSGVSPSPSQADQFIPPLNTALYPANGASPAQWNYSDNAVSQPYGVFGPNGCGKPGLQAYYEKGLAYLLGAIQNANGWFTFLNYYFWMQSCVDYHIGRVLTSLSSSPFASNTIILFTSDHGDYGGSHNLHTKGGALYDESLNVPLYISFPKMRPPFAPAPVERTRSFVCSSVDIFPLLYTLALGNSNWRNNPSDPYSYLSGREAILDAIFSTAPVQRRVSSIPNQANTGFLPYILHTTDEVSAAVAPSTGAPQPSHAIAFRTVDTGVTTTVGGVTFYGGAKLGMYNYWPCGSTTPDPSKTPQYEFYDYTAGNVAETGNSALSAPNQLSAAAASYLAAYNAIAQTELYVQFPQVQTAAQAASAGYAAYLKLKAFC